MKQIKINIDRPKMSSKEIKSHMNFDDILTNYQIIHKPFYQSKWFYGITGLASISLIASFIYHNNASSYYRPIDNKNLISTTNFKKNKESNTRITFNEKITLKNKMPIDKTTTFKQTENHSLKNTQKQTVKKNKISNKITTTDLNKENLSINESKKKTFNLFDLHPRIANKVSGNITKEELFDDKGLITYADVKIVQFELHLIDALGGKIFTENSNQLNEEMKKAIEQINKTEDIYFENIKGSNTEGLIVKLSPLKYTLLN
jgi:hypothetical protein